MAAIVVIGRCRCVKLVVKGVSRQQQDLCKGEEVMSRRNKARKAARLAGKKPHARIASVPHKQSSPCWHGLESDR